jgi:protein-S-isoprenylcysteine O-methyltransferase Ste14
MLDPLVVRILSVLLPTGTIVGLVVFVRRSGIQKGTKTVRAARPTGVLTREAWGLLGLVPFAFLFLGAVAPTWVYGTPFNLAFPGGEIVQIGAIAIWLGGGLLGSQSVRALGRFMVVEIEVRSDHQLVMHGPYTRIRHPMYTALLLLDGAVALLFLHVALIVSFFLRVLIAEVRARREEELLASNDAFGDVVPIALALRSSRSGFVPQSRLRGNCDVANAPARGNHPLAGSRLLPII